jgi:2-dehydropantoate 2-reductase
VTASLTTRNRRVGVIATPATVRSHAYFSAIKDENPAVEVYEHATPALVPLVEAGRLTGPAVEAIVGEARTIGCFVNFGADYLEPGVIQYAGRGAVVLGEIDGRRTPRIEELHRAFLDFDDRAIVTANIWGFLWGKLAYGAQLFATALTNDSIADALADPRYRDLYIEIAREVMRVARARGITPEGFNGFDPHAFAPDADGEVAERSLDDMVAFNRKSAKTHSGIWRDIAVRKRRTETDAQLGPIVTLGAEAGVPTPMVSRLIALMHEVEDGRRPQSHDTLDLLKASLRV